jgi:Lrp/AsnC family transcriptional regulator for asnA, asnC and gidA
MIRISNQDLINALKNNARIPYVELAKKLGVSETAIRKRVKKMEESGIIKKYVLEIDHRKIGYEINVFIGIDTLPEKYISITNKLKDFEEINKLYSTSGDHMILIESWLKSSKELSDFINKLEKIEGIIRICPAIVMEKIK